MSRSIRLFRFCLRCLRRGLVHLLVYGLLFITCLWLGKATAGVGRKRVLRLGPHSGAQTPAETDPLRLKLALLVRESSMARLQIALHDLSAAELQHTMDIALEWPGGERSLLFLFASQALAFRDPRSAIDLALKMRPGMDRTLRLAEIFGLWAKQDPQTALARWRELQDLPENGDYGFGAIVKEMAKRDLPAAFATVGDIPELNYGFYPAVEACVAPFAQTARREEMLNALLAAKPGVRAFGLQFAFREGDYSTPAARDEAARWIAEKGLTGDEKYCAEQAVAQSAIIRGDPEAGADWLIAQSTSPDGRVSPRRYDCIVGVWARMDLNAAGEWLNRQPRGPELDGAHTTFARYAAAEDIAAAFVWTGQIIDPGRRAAAAAEVVKAAKERASKSEIRTAISASALSAGEKSAAAAALDR